MQTRSFHPSSKDISALVAAEAYVKPIMQEGRRCYAIHAQDGRPIALAATRELAFAFLDREDVAGADVH